MLLHVGDPVNVLHWQDPWHRMMVMMMMMKRR